MSKRTLRGKVTRSGKPLLPIYGAYDPSSLKLLSEGIPTYPRSITVSNNKLGEEFTNSFPGRACLMRGHGITTCGDSVLEASLTAIKLNELAEMNYRAQLLGDLRLGALHRLCLLTYPFDETHSVTRLPRPDAQQTRILQALQVPLPHREQCRQEHDSLRIATTH